MFRIRKHCFAAMADGDEDVVHVCGDCLDDLLEEIEIQEWKARWFAETGLGEEVLNARILYLLWLLKKYPAKEEESKEDESKAEGEQKDDTPAGSSTDQLDEKKEDKSKAEGDKKEDNNRAEGQKDDTPAGSSTDQLDEKKEDKSKAEGDKKEDNNRAEGEKMDPGFFEMD